MKLTDNQIQKAVDWWAIAITKLENSSVKIKEKNIEKFKKELATILKKDNPRYIGCDYSPGLILYDAMHKAGIDSLNAPWKTTMIFVDGMVKVRNSYKAKYKKID